MNKVWTAVREDKCVDIIWVLLLEKISVGYHLGTAVREDKCVDIIWVLLLEKISVWISFEYCC